MDNVIIFLKHLSHNKAYGRETMLMYEPVDASFFNEPTLELAKKMLGNFLVHEHHCGLLVGRIVETEAYQGPEDRAAHSFRNRRTKRTEIMFGDNGRVYTYQMHTHTLINIVSGSVGTPHAVLIRAVEPLDGKALMQTYRGNHLKDINLTNGPGKLTKALCITMDYYGHPLTERPLYIARGPEPKKIVAGPRVGIAGAKEAVHYPWRFYDKHSPYVSKYRK